jgi:hypothetical protein
VAEETAVYIRMEEIDLPAGPGTIIRLYVNDAGHGEFFGPDGPRLGWGYTLKVNDDRWRAILVAVTAWKEGSVATFRIEGRYEDA